MSSKSIGVFDSGLGGLTVLKALQESLPNERYVYLGDMARLPYGTKSPETVANYAVQVARHLVAEDIKFLVIACNTASALGMVRIQEKFSDLPCVGVIEPGAEAAVKATRNKKVVVFSTEGTAHSHAYRNAIHKLDAGIEVEEVPANLLVSLVEEGWAESVEAEAILRRYLSTVELSEFDTLVLGCTHFPLLKPTLQKLLPENVRIVDSAETTAAAVKAQLSARSLLGSGDSATHFYTTDGAERFAKLAKKFLPSVDKANVDLVDL